MGAVDFYIRLICAGGIAFEWSLPPFSYAEDKKAHERTTLSTLSLLGAERARATAREALAQKGLGIVQKKNMPKMDRETASSIRTLKNFA